MGPRLSPGYHRSDGPTQPRALSGAARAGGLRRRAPHGDQRRRATTAALARAAPTPAASATATPDEEAEGAQAAARPTRSSRATRHPPSRRRRTCRCHRSRSSTPTSTTRRCPSGRRSSCASERPRPRGGCSPPCWRSRSRPPRAPPTRPRPISAPSALVVEASTADVAYAKQPDRRRAIASATKLMTALLTLERSRPSTVLPRRPLPRAARRVEDQPAPGEQMTVADLLRGLLIESANDAAATLADARRRLARPRSCAR